MRVTLKPDVERYVHEQVKNGRFGSAEDVLNSAVARLMRDERATQAVGFDPGELNRLIAEAEAQFRRGEGIDAEDVFAEIAQMSKASRRRQSRRST